MVKFDFVWKRKINSILRNTKYFVIPPTIHNAMGFNRGDHVNISFYRENNLIYGVFWKNIDKNKTKENKDEENNN